MTPGVGYSSVSDQATSITSSKALNANYPIENALDIISPSKLARHTATGQTDIIITWPSAVQVQMISLINHNGNASCSAACSRWSSLPVDIGSNPGGQIDSKTVAFPTPVSGYPQVLPIVFDTVQPIRGVLLSLTGNAAAWEIGAASDDDSWAPRTFNGQIDYLAMGIAAGLGVNFQKIQGKQKPFVFVKDLADPSTWPRTAMQARNVEVPPSVGAMYRHDRFQFRLIEHWR